MDTYLHPSLKSLTGANLMSPTLKKTFAVLMILVTSIGILLSLFFLFLTWRARQPVTEKLQSVSQQASSLLQTTIVGLDIIDQVVTNVYSSTLYLDDATNALAQTIENTDQFIASAGSFLGEGFNTTITNTQKTIESAQASALVVDNILTMLSNIPLIGLDYNPSTPLSTALGDVSTSLDPIQESLKGFQDNLVATQSNLQLFVDQLELMEQNISEINQNLASSQAVIENYITQVTSMKEWLDNAVVSLPTWITTVCVMLTIFIMLLIFVQGGILLQGIYMFQNAGISTIETSISVSGVNEQNLDNLSIDDTTAKDDRTYLDEIKQENSKTE
jgi:predicted PurR-regulated permease PerM